MTKNHALKMAIEAFETCKTYNAYEQSFETILVEKATQACKEALAQPAQDWVGLSEDEIEYWECLKAPPVHPDFVDDDSWRNFAKAIEQALKEKNDGNN